ncbi:MAG: tRNA pseudouridine(54/55) synthase Pus10 [Thermoprotei archaeon]
MSTITEWYKLVPIERVKELIRKYPLCDHCLGRVFAKLGLDLGNDERGKAIKTILQMVLHNEYNKGTITCNELRVFAENSGDPISRLYAKLCGEKISNKPCHICSSKLSREYFEVLAKKIAKKLEELNAYRFILGVTIPQELALKEIEVYKTVGLELSESIKNEIKREVGKIIRDKYGFTPDFDNPEVMIIIDYLSDELTTIINPILFEGRYWKRGRNISHTPWLDKYGRRVYPYSLYDYFNDSLREVFEAREVILHASGREDVDARMLGNGRPFVLEIKDPKFRYVDIELVNALTKSDLIEARITGSSSRSRIEYLKGEGSKKRKAYKLLIVSEKDLDVNKLEKLEEEFNNRIIKQYTPIRILRRKKERLRIRKVYSVRIKPISNRVFEALIYCDGGLYVKELVHGDNGRTTPSFSEIMGGKLTPVEIDVFGVETQ